MDDVVRLASVGLGWWGGVLDSAARRVAGVELMACFSRTDSTRAAFADEHACRAASSWDDLLADPEIDGVLIATPHSTHADLIVDVASAGKHVFVENPFTLTIAEGKLAIAAAEGAGIVLQVGRNRRRQPATRRLKELVDRGELGMIHHRGQPLLSQGTQPADRVAGGARGA